MMENVQSHPLSDVQSINIGPNTSIWQFVVIMPGAIIGSDCNIGSHCFIENNVRISDRVTIKNGVHVFDNCFIESDVFIGPNVTFTNDPYPRSRRSKSKGEKIYPNTFIKNGVSIGGGSTILPGVTIGANSIVGAGSIVTKDIPENSVVYGVGASIRRSLIGNKF